MKDVMRLKRCRREREKKTWKNLETSILWGACSLSPKTFLCSVGCVCVLPGTLCSFISGAPKKNLKWGVCVGELFPARFLQPGRSIANRKKRAAARYKSTLIEAKRKQQIKGKSKSSPRAATDSESNYANYDTVKGLHIGACQGPGRK